MKLFVSIMRFLTRIGHRISPQKFLPTNNQHRKNKIHIFLELFLHIEEISRNDYLSVYMLPLLCEDDLLLWYSMSEDIFC